VTGQTWSTDYPVTAGASAGGAGDAFATKLNADLPVSAGAPQQTLNGAADAFVSRLGADGTALAVSTFLGGGDYDVGTAIAIGRHGTYVAGQTLSAGYPTTPGASDHDFNGRRDPFVTKLQRWRELRAQDLITDGMTR
jgi:hypothetical protein